MDNLQPFVRKLHLIGKLAQDPASVCSGVWAWSETGESFEIKNKESFCQNVLCEYFRSNAFPSFLHQLSVYGFKRTASARYEFRHHYFRRDRPDLLVHIVRKSSASQQARAKKRKREVTGVGQASASKKKPPKPSFSAGPKNDIEKVREDIKGLESSVKLILKELRVMKKSGFNEQEKEGLLRTLAVSSLETGKRPMSPSLSGNDVESLDQPEAWGWLDSIPMEMANPGLLFSPLPALGQLEQQPENDGQVFQEAYASFVNQARQGKAEGRLRSLKSIIASIAWGSGESGTSRPSDQAPKDDIASARCTEHKSALVIQLIGSFPTPFRAGREKALVEMSRICLYCTKYDVWKALRLLHFYVRFRFQFISNDLNEQVTVFAKGMVAAMKEKNVLLMRQKNNGLPVVVVRHSVFGDFCRHDLLHGLKIFHFVLLASCRMFPDIADNKAGVCVVLDCCPAKAGAEKETVVFLSNLVLLFQLIKISSWPVLRGNGKFFSVAPDNGPWAEVFDSVKTILGSAEVPFLSAIADRASSCSELSRHLPPFCLPSRMGGTGAAIDLYGLCNTWVRNDSDK